MWISMFYLTVSLGVVLGFLASAAVSNLLNLGFQYAFLVQGVIMVLLGFIMMMYPHYYYESEKKENKKDITKESEKE